MKTNAYAGLIALSAAALMAGAAAAQTATPMAAPDRAEVARHARLDANGDRKISEAEFVAARTARLTALDADHDGSVASAEVRARMQAGRAERAARRFDRLDADEDGQISRAEFDAAGARRGEGRSDRGHRMARHAGRGEGRGHGPADRMADRGPVSIANAQTRAAATFVRLDVDHDGFLTHAEVRAARGERGGRGQGRAARRMGRAMAPAETPASPPAPASE